VRVLVVAATRPEVQPLLSALARPAEHNRLISGALGTTDVEVLLTGVGMVATAVWCTRVLATGRYDLALNLGVCGSFSAALPPPTVVQVTSDMFSELGAQDGSNFITVEELGLQDPDAFPYSGGHLLNATAPSLPALAALPIARGITVNTVHGEDGSIAAVSARCRADVESMEGAAFMFACLVAPSNRVERRNRSAWDLGGAVQELGRVSVNLLERP
jgi:futalosine hydrolase